MLDRVMRVRGAAAAVAALAVLAAPAAGCGGGGSAGGAAGSGSFPGASSLPAALRGRPAPTFRLADARASSCASGV